MKQKRWLDEYGEMKQAVKADQLQKEAFFGYQKVSEDEKSQWVLRHFNSVARRYDLMNTLLSFGIHHLWKRSAVKMMGLKAGDRVLDVCGGTGDLAILAAESVGRSGQVIIYDINRAMIEAGVQKIKHLPLEDRIRFVQGDAERISFPDGSFDAAMVGFGIRNVTHMDQGFKEMCRVLKPGGKMMCLEFSKPTWPLFRWMYDVYSFHVMPALGEIFAGSSKAYLHLTESIRTFALPDELTAVLKKVGFSEVTERKLTNGIAMIHLALKG
ncbi:MAG: bifunctional demethylmenaquinone methyltransferase/2-methoxy-6-polyprenyl-1,4-benzoquinol methylase UbiE [Desulfobacterales bacterium]|jgi:demethylmenaquinone methyltransferase/2-methoxy-6-polyprenyl-1,4-benzoquinol methylase